MHNSHLSPTKHQPHNTNTHTSTFNEISFTQVQIDTIYHPFYNTSTLLNTTPTIQQNIYNHHTPNHIHYTSQTVPYTPSAQAPTHHTNNYNLVTKTMHTSTAQPPQQTSHKLSQNRHQTNTIHPQHTTTSLSHPISQIFHQQISSDIINLILQHSNQAASQKRHRL